MLHTSQAIFGSTDDSIVRGSTAPRLIGCGTLLLLTNQGAAWTYEV